MSAQEKYEPREFSITGTVRAPESVGAEQLAESLKRGLEQSRLGATVDLGDFTKYVTDDAEDEFVVGQQVSGDDYERLPVGSVVTLQRAGRPGDGDSLTKADETGWDDGRGDGYIRNDGLSVSRTLTHLGDGTHSEPEDKDDLYVEPEPLKEGDWVQVWAQVRDPEPDPDGDFRLHIRRLQTEGTSYTNAYAHPDAIVRPDAGQVPPWVKPAEEPMGLGAVVDAEHAGEDVRFVRVGGDDTRHPWYAWLDERSYYTDWTALKDPKVLSEGYVAGGAS